MEWIWNRYLNFSIKVRLATLCLCYSACIVATGIAAQSGSLLVKYGSMLLFITLGGIFGWINIWSINRPIQRSINYLQTMASGDLSQEIRVLRKNEFSKMLTAMIELQKSIREIIAGIKGTAGELTDASRLLSTTSADIVQGTGDASSQSDSVSYAVGELSTVAVTISGSCQEMADSAAATEAATQKGAETAASMSQVMAEIERMVVSTMEAVKALGENSERIGTIIDAIEDIADQTNLLALNAAIEAARAGEQGRGFAVVADEVRGLAERTSASTKEIQTIITTLQGDVKNVVTLMDKSADSVRTGAEDVRFSNQAISTIAEQMAPLVARVSQVATAAEEQSATSAGITESMQHIARIIHSAAAGAHETAKAAAVLADSSANLEQMVNRFKLQ
ncbi:methyl-accepting chemotaxis protein [Geotalea sp. SG265]|uniref:methyl-accepting chemotaxis protein n=1 Tax=Geotalea sp. SG265 TaxID=2922867 RepID=UPI001FAF230A|nr:methyl-accepting chemotaxis protein [Geotalea sp. SG265]